VLFLDMGNVWTDPSYLFCRGWAGPGKGLVSTTCGPFELRAAIGTGLRIATPVGPIVFDYGFNITRQPYDDIGAFNFAIGLF
jgi:outer membrane protein assembly factor BamA